MDIGGKPMLQHVYERARQSGADEVIVATDDERIRRSASGFGAAVQMTANHHLSGTERIAEVVRNGSQAAEHIIVNVQGDEPLIAPTLISQVAELLDSTSGANMATLCEPIATAEALFDPDVVKVVRDAADWALYFSRAPIPWHRQDFSAERQSLPRDQTYYRHLGIYAYRVSYLLDFVGNDATSIERTESLEQLRALYHGGRIVVSTARGKSGPAVDTAKDLKRVRELVVG